MNICHPSLEIVLKLAFSLCRNETELSNYARNIKDLIAMATPEKQEAARVIYTQRRDELRAERAPS